MGILSWLRSLVADFFHADRDDLDEAARRAREELEELRGLAVFAVAQARRTELELREALAEAEPDRARLVWLVPRLEEERARAEALVERFHQREQEEEDRLSRLGSVRAAHELNDRRERLQAELARADGAADEEELTRLEDEARANAHRLDVLVALQEGRDLPSVGKHMAEADADLLERARRLVDQSRDEELTRED